MGADARTLSAEHRAVLEQRSAISSEVISERRAWTAETWHDLAGLGFRGSQKRAECFPALMLPQWAVDGENVYTVARWDTPRVTPVARKQIRYDTPAGVTLRLDVPPRCRLALANPDLPLWVTEGTRKADVLASAGLIAVSLPGVWTWKTTAIQADFDSIQLRERRVIIAFDSDMLTNAKVRLAAIRLGRWLANRRADVRVVNWRAVLEHTA